MGKIIVFGAGGRAGRASVQEARRRGHEVTGVVRDPAKVTASDGVRIVAGDVTDVKAVAAYAQGHDAAICGVYDASAQPDDFYAGTAHALVEGLAQAGVTRLLVVGLASILETESGVLLMDTPGYPQAYRTFYLGHAAGTAVLQASAGTLDWLVMSPSGDFDHTGGDVGGYRVAPADADSRITYADFALALLDEIDNPTHHRTHVGVERNQHTA